jgi:MSHA type pilus biogenesis protein MshL
MKKLVYFLLGIGVFAGTPYYKLDKELPKYYWQSPLVCEVEVPSGIVNGFFVPTHKQLVIVSPMFASIKTEAPQETQQDIQKTEGKTTKTEEKITKTEMETKTTKPEQKVVVEAIPEEMNKPITCSFSDVPVRVALSQLAMDYNLKFIVSQDVPSDVKISCFASNTPLSSVLDDITTQINATYSYREGKIYIYVFGTKLFKVCLPNITHSFKSSISTTGFGGEGTTTSGTQTTGTTTTSTSEAGPNTEVVIKVDELKIYDEIEKNLKAILSKEGKYGINKNTGIITITDYAQNLKEAEKFLSEVNSEFSRQVSLQAKIMEVELSDKNQTGINWDYLAKRVSASTNFSLVSSGNVLTLRTKDSPNAGTTEKGLSVIINALSEYGKVNILSQPSLTVLNTQPACIQVGAVKNYISSMTQETTQAGFLTGFGTSQITEGLTLSLIAKINPDNKVYLSLMPTIKEVSEIRTIPIPGGTLEAPNVNTRALNTSVVVEQGDTLILGGLIRERDELREQKTPVLSSVPILGNLFKQKTKSKVRTELVLLLTIEGVK